MQAIHSLASSLHDSTLLAPGPWHWLFLLPGMLSPQIICMALTVTSLGLCSIGPCLLHLP